MALNEQEKTLVRYYMGYPGVSRVRLISLGIPDVTQTNFITEFNMDNILVEAEPLIRHSLQELQCIESKMSELRRSMEVKSIVGSMQFDYETAFERLREEFVQWVCTLADNLGAPVNPFGNRLNRFN